MSAPTRFVQGEGGAIYEMDVYPEGSRARELFDEAVAKGRLRFVDGAKRVVDPDGAVRFVIGGKAAPKAEPEPVLVTEPIVDMRERADRLGVDVPADADEELVVMLVEDRESTLLDMDDDAFDREAEALDMTPVELRELLG